MDKIEIFKQAVRNLSDYVGTDYAAKPENWCVVHATKYMPLRHKDGTMYIPSTAMATNFDVPRTTVHTTFNHVVTSHMMGSWDDMPIVVMAPYTDVAKENGNPAQISAVDTYWSVNPKRGLVLPDNAYIVQPSNDVLFSVNEHGATYKRDNYTDEEVKMILEMLNPEERETFEKYEKGDFKDYEIEHEFYIDNRVKKMYESAKDKQAFLRGLFEENRFDILSHYLRNTVVRLAMKKIGFYKIQGIYDGSYTSTIIKDAATKMGIQATASNKGHSNSIYAEMEDFWGRIKTVFNGGFDEYGVINAPDFKSLLGYISSHSENRIIQEIVKSLTENKPLDFIDLYEKHFISEINQHISWAGLYTQTLQNELLDIERYDISEQEKDQRRAEVYQKQQENAEYLKELNAIKKISDFDANLSEVLYKNAEILSAEYETRRKNLMSRPGYDDFIQKLQDQYNMANQKNADILLANNTRF